jgi:hypothetical protein
MMAMLRSFMGEEAFSDGRRPNHAGRAALSFGREGDGNATASPALAVALARYDCAAQYTKRRRKGRAIGFRRLAGPGVGCDRLGFAVGMKQAEFAAACQFSVRTAQECERGRARTLLHAIKTDLEVCDARPGRVSASP